MLIQDEWATDQAEFHSEPHTISNVRLRTCIYGFQYPFPLQSHCRGMLQSRFIEDLVAQLADTVNVDRFAMLFMAINREQEISDQAGKHLDHQAMAASRNEVVDLEVPLPPGKERFYVPTQLVDQSDLFGGEIKAIGGNPVSLASDLVAD